MGAAAVAFVVVAGVGGLPAQAVECNNGGAGSNPSGNDGGNVGSTTCGDSSAAGGANGLNTAYGFGANAQGDNAANVATGFLRLGMTVEF
jgi:hypothetical protein